MLLFQLLTSGFAQGCIYGLLAMGVSLIYQARQTVSLAQGELMMLGAWFTLVGAVALGAPFWLAAFGGVLCTALLGGLIERLVFRPLLRKPAWVASLLTLGVAFGARTFIVATTDSGLSTTTLPWAYPDETWLLAGLPFQVGHLTSILVTAMVCGMLYALIRFTKVGFALHAALHNRLAARHMGLPVRYLDTAIWMLASVLAAVAGLLLAAGTPVDNDMAFTGFKALAAVLIGGLWGLRGALLGGLLIGMIEALASVVLPNEWHDSPGYMVALVVWLLRQVANKKAL